MKEKALDGRIGLEGLNTILCVDSGEGDLDFGERPGENVYELSIL